MNSVLENRIRYIFKRAPLDLHLSHDLFCVDFMDDEMLTNPKLVYLKEITKDSSLMDGLMKVGNINCAARQRLCYFYVDDRINNLSQEEAVQNLRTALSAAEEQWGPLN